MEWPKRNLSSNDSCFQIQNYSTYYKGIYILNNNSNTTFGKLYIPFVKMALMLAFIISFFATIRVYNDLHILSLFLLVSIAFTSVLMIGPISMVMSSLYDMSSKFECNVLTKIQAVVDNKRSRRIYELQIKSCPLIRCQVGSFYHMEAKAKLTIIHNVLHGIVFLMVNTE